MKNTFLLLVISFFAIQSFAQAPKMVKITGETFIMGGGYQYKVVDYRMHYIGSDADYAKMNAGSVAIGEVPSFNNPERMVTLHSFEISPTEVTNKEYREFMLNYLLSEAEVVKFRKELKAAKEAADKLELWRSLIDKPKSEEVLPDNDCWERDFVFAYNEPLTENYYWHPAFDDYPVVGVSWTQARKYCQWLTEVSGEAGEYRLPTEAEWEYAARGIVSKEGKERTIWLRQIYPWPGTEVWGKKGYLANIKTGNSNYIGDNYEYTAPVKWFEPNGFGLYDMAGNVSEWCEDVFRVNTDDGAETASAEFGANVRVVKGGSWADYKYAAMCGSRTLMEDGKGYSRVGFRVARTIAGGK